MAFKLKSGNKTNFKSMGSSPAKQKPTSLPGIYKEEGFGPWNQGGVKNPELTGDKKKERKVMKDGPKNKVHNTTDTNWQPHQFKSPAKHGKLEDFQYGRNGHNPDTMSAKHEDWHLKQSGESPIKQLVEKYWYKINGKPVSKNEYIKYKNVPGNMEGGGKTTNDPNVSLAKKSLEKRKNNKASKRPTVLTKEQTELLKKKNK